MRINYDFHYYLFYFIIYFNSNIRCSICKRGNIMSENYSETTLAIVNFEIYKLQLEKEEITTRLVKLYDIRKSVEDKIKDEYRHVNCCDCHE